MKAGAAQRHPLGLVAKLGQAGLRGSIQELSTSGSVSAPVVVELDPTSYCDLSCPECISADLLNDGRFSAQRLRRLAHEIVQMGVSAVILIGGGEPLLHPGVDDVIQILADGNVKIGLTTNGTQIHRHLAAISSCMSWTRVSVDAATPESYAQFRPSRADVNQFPQIIAAMRALAKQKKGSLGYSFLLLSRESPDGGAGMKVISNFHEITAAARLAEDIGCDYLEIKPQYDMGHYLVDHHPELIAVLTEQLEELEAMPGLGVQVLYPPHLLDVLRGRPLTQPKDYSHCPVAELRTLVTPRGAYICPYHRGNPHARYGDLVAHSLGEIWNSPQRRQVMSAIEPSAHCQFHCIRHNSNLALLQVRGGGGWLAEAPLADYDPFI